MGRGVILTSYACLLNFYENWNRWTGFLSPDQPHLVGGDITGHGPLLACYSCTSPLALFLFYPLMINFLPVTPCVDSFNWIARFCNIVHHGGSSYNDFAQDSLQQGTQDCAAYAGEIPQRSAFLIPQLAIQVLVPQQKNSVLIVKPGQHGRVAVIGGSLEYVHSSNVSMYRSYWQSSSYTGAPYFSSMASARLGMWLNNVHEGDYVD